MKKLTLILASLLMLGMQSVSAYSFLPDNVDVKPLRVKAGNMQKPTGTLSNFAPAKVEANTAIPEDATDMYAFQMWGYGSVETGFLNFPSYNPDARTFLRDYGQNDGADVISAGTFVGDTYYGFVVRSYQNGAFVDILGLATVDLTTGAYTMVAEYPDELIPWNETFYEMSYDPTAGLIYAIQTEYNGSNPTNRTKIWTIDPSVSNPQPTHVATIEEYLWTMSVDRGVIYGIVQNNSNQVDVNGYPIPKDINLVTINASSIAGGTCTVNTGAKIDGGNRVIDWSQSMEFDHTTHSLWWAGQAYGANGGWICKIDTQTGDLSDYKELPMSSQYVALGIPYQTVSDAAPQYVTELVVTPAAEGGLGATITWKNPSVNYALGTLSDLQGVKIYRDGQLMEDMATTAVGAAMTWADNSVTEGLHTYKLLPYNSAGDGIYKTRKVYVGQDVPAAPTAVEVVVEGAQATITWTAPTTGLHGGYITTGDITYDVVRLPDNLTIASNITATTATDEVIEYKGYSYRVVARNAKGQGGEAVSEVIPFGTYMGTPYINKMATQEDFNEMSIIDDNRDGNSWYYTQNDYTGLSGPGAYYYYNDYAPNDFLVTPPLYMQEGEEYEVIFEYFTSNWSGCIEKLRVMAGFEATKEGLSECILDLPQMIPGEGVTWRRKSAVYKATETGGGHIAFNIYSDADMGFLLIRNVVVRHISPSDLRAEEVLGSNIAYVDNEISHRIKVHNTGNTTVNGAMAQLVSEDGNLLAQGPVGKIEAGEVKYVDVLWTPSSTGDVTFHGEIQLGSDTYTDDNVTPNSIEVSMREVDGDKLYTIGVFEDTGWRPIFLGHNYSEMQTIYYAHDITMTDFDFTGMQYLYTAVSDTYGMDAVPLTIYMMHTDLDSMDSLLPEEDFTMVFDGEVDITGQGAVNALNVVFDTPFKYEGGNIVMKVVSYKTYQLTNVNWYIENEDFEGLPCHSWIAVGETKNAALADAYDNYYIPYVRFAYSGGTGVEDFGVASQLLVSRQGDSLYFSLPCDEVYVYSVAGEMVAKVANADMLSLDQLNAGIYVVKAVSGNNVTTIKVVK